MDEVDVRQPTDSAEGAQGQTRQAGESTPHTTVYKLGGWQYFKAVLWLPVRVVLLGGLGGIHSNAVGCVGIALAFVWLVINIKQLKRVSLTVDHKGVWYEAGLLKENQVRHGVRWSDIGDATCVINKGNMSSNAYRFELTQRFTGEVRIEVDELVGCKEAVALINDEVTRRRG